MGHLGTGYRLSVSYDAALVLHRQHAPDSRAGAGAQPRRQGCGPIATARLAPRIERFLPPTARRAARPGDPVTLADSNLDAVADFAVTGYAWPPPACCPSPRPPPGRPSSRSPRRRRCPPAPCAIAPHFDDRGGRPIAGERRALLALAPTIVSKATFKAKLDDKGRATLKLKVPPVEAGQTIALIIGDQVSRSLH